MYTIILHSSWYLPACLSWGNVTLCWNRKAAQGLVDITFTGVTGPPHLQQALHWAVIRGQGENLPYFWIYLLYGHIRGIFASIYHILNTSGHLFNSTVILKKCTKSKINLSKSSLRISFISSIICVYKLNNKITCICDVCPLDRY